MSLLLTRSCCSCRENIDIEKELEGQSKATPSNVLLHDHDAPLFDPAKAQTIFTVRADPDAIGAGLNEYQGYDRSDIELSDSPLHPDTFAPPLEDHPAFNEVSRHSSREDNTTQKRVSSNEHNDPIDEKPPSEAETTDPPIESTKEAPKPKPKAKRKPKPVETTPPAKIEAPIETNINEPVVEEKVVGHPGKILQVRMDNGWCDFDDDVMKQINNNLKLRAEFFSINTGGQMYMVDFRDLNNITTINPNTRKVRNLRLIDGNQANADDMDAKDEVIVTFFPGPIGLVHLPDGTVDEILPGSQGEREGVKVGWRIVAVNQTKISGFHEKAFTDAKDGDKAYTVTLVKGDARSVSSGEQDMSKQPKCCVIS